MKFYPRFFLRLFAVIAALYILICTLVYFNQESLLFHPQPVASETRYDFGIPFTEKSIRVDGSTTLNGVLFEVAASKGLIFFVHGNAGNLSDLTSPAEFYTGLGYDFFAYDFRGFGKSGGTITSEAQFYSDAQLAYNHLRKEYLEKEIVIAGYSVGTATAAMLAANNHPEKLILMAPYYSMEELAAYHYPFIPRFLVSYKFKTFDFLSNVTVPVIIGHGKNDGTIPYEASLRLKKLLKRNGTFVGLDGEGHNGVQSNELFQAELRKFLD